MKNILLITILSFFFIGTIEAQTPDPTKVYSRFPKQEYGRKKSKTDKQVTPPIKEVKEPVKEVVEELVQPVKEVEPTKVVIEKKREEVKEKTPVKRTKVVPPVRVTNNQSNYDTGVWTLERCIQYARENNLQVSDAELTRRMSELTYEQSKASRYPNLNGDVSLGNSYGRGIDPTTNQFVNQRFLFNNAGLNSQVLLFGWFQKKNEIEQNKLSLQAAEETYKQLQDDIALNIATGYLRILLAREQVNVSLEQLKTDKAQLRQTQQFVNAGKLPELNVAQMQAQVAADSSTLITSITEEQLALLQLRALMNFSFDKDFDIAAPSIDAEQTFLAYDLPNAEGVYDLAMKNLHRVKARYLNLLSARKGLDLARASQYPSLFLGGNIGTSFSSNFQEITGQTYAGERSVGFVNVGGTQYPLTTPQYDFATRTIPYGTQLGNNVRSNIALTLNVPIFNGLVNKTNIERAKVGLVSQQIALETEQLNLRQDVYKARLEAQAALQKYKAAESQKTSAKRALDFGIQRYNIGMLSTFEYTQTQNSYNQASSNALSAKYEMLFKLKVLDYYMGNPIKL